MSEQTTATGQRWGEGVRLSPPRLYALSFQYEGDGHIPQPVQMQFGMELYRLELYTLTVDFTSTVMNVPDLTAEVTYRAEFQLDPASPEAEEPERALQMLAARVAPVTLYPFCREALVSCAQRAGLNKFVAPITNVGALWELNEVEVPDVGFGDDEES